MTKLFALDNHILIWGIKGFAEEDQQDKIPQAKEFLKRCKEDNIILMIPSIVAGEFLTATEPEHHAAVARMLSDMCWIPPYDLASSIQFARLWREKKQNGVIDNISKNLGATRQEIKADGMIVATAIRHNADAIYSYDGKLKSFANGNILVEHMPRYATQATFGEHYPNADDWTSHIGK